MALVSVSNFISEYFHELDHGYVLKLVHVFESAFQSGALNFCMSTFQFVECLLFGSSKLLKRLCCILQFVR